MKKSLADLKRDLFVGRKIKCVFNSCGKYVGMERSVVKVQSNGIYIKTIINGEESKSFLDFPKTKVLLEYEDNKFSIYSRGTRDYNSEELKALEEWNKIKNTEEYQEQSSYDIMTDGSTTYWQEKIFWKNHNMSYMFGEEEKGLYRDTNLDKIYDNQVRGRLMYSYELD